MGFELPEDVVATPDNEDAPQAVPDKKVLKNGLRRTIGKVFALGSVAGLGIFGSIDNARAGEESAVPVARTNNIEHAKGSSLGVYYQKKFEHNDKEKADFKQMLAYSKEILTEKGISFTEKSDIKMELKSGILTKIILDGKVIEVGDEYRTDEENIRVKLANTAKDTNNVNSVSSKTVVSGEAADFLK